MALIALTLVLAVVAAGGVAALIRARQRYEDILVGSTAASTAVANLLTAGVAEQEVLQTATGPGTAVLRRQAAQAYATAATVALAAAHSDPASLRLVRAQIGAHGAGRAAQARTEANRGQARQRERQTQAGGRSRADSRSALLVVVIAGVLALFGALALIAALVASMRRPLDALVAATRDLAAGQLDRRVVPAGPRELQQLGHSFNAMGEELAAAQRRLEAERQRLAITIESLGDGLIVSEPGSPRIAALNPRATELVPSLTPGERADASGSPLPPLAEALEKEVLVEQAGRVLSITAARLENDGEGILWTVRDMTERTRLERAKSEFVAMASHELRSPLTSIKGFVELLERSPENMSERQREFIDIILRSTDRLVDLVNDLLEVAQIEADRVELNRRPIDLGEAIREVTELMGPRIAAKDQQLGVYVAPTLPFALADAGRVRQIVANLLTNAHLYTPEHGRVHVGVEPDRAWLQIVVADSGVGMTRDETSRIFERFYRGSRGTSSSPGTGLGLSIVKSLVEMHNGQIEVESAPGQGTTIRVLLPTAVQGSESARLLDAIRGRRVLVVDDEPQIAELIAGQLAPLDVQTTVVPSGEEALERLRDEHYDAITLDILMPGMDGFEVLRHIRSDPDLATTPIVFVSVFSGRRELAGEWVVSKPIDADELRDVLGAAVSAGRSRVLVVGREELQPVLEPALDEMGIEHEWELSGTAAARVCGERRFEVALVDVGIRSPQAVLQALDLRGRRLRRAVILFSDGDTPAPPGIGSLGMEVIPVQDAAGALLAALRGDREQVP